jgi:energy-coupling factor transporter ATPase
LSIVEVKDLCYTYPNASVLALNKINLSINPGEFIVLTGPSGCGKTTFCRCLNGLIPHFYNGTLTGDVIVSGLFTKNHEIVDLAQTVGMIFQNPDNQIFALTVEKDVAFGLENLGIPKDKMINEIDWATKLTGIYNLKERGTHELSGGQKQRLTIASVLAMHPKIIVMDEPTSFLDPLGAETIFEVLNILNKEKGITIILIEHRMDLAVKYADRIIVFDEGKIVNDGKPFEIFNAEETRLLGIGIPKILNLAKRLSQKGINVDSPLKYEDLYELLKPKIQKINIANDLKNSINYNDFTGIYQNKPIIKVENISFSYPGVEALKDVSLTIHEGEYVAIMGENGAGKTTLVKHFNGLLRPKKGKVLLNDVDILKTSVASLAQKIGLVFQSPDDQLFAEDVKEEISFALRNFGYNENVINQRVDWALNLLDIMKYKDTSPFILSGGERKRVALASVLAWNPQVLVLDEPTIGQDHGQKEKLKHFLNQLCTQGKTVVIVTHDVEFVAESQPRIILMAKGSIHADGSTRDIMSKPEILKQCSVSPPEITKLFQKLSIYGFPNNVLDVDEATKIFENHLKENNS